MDFKKRKTVLNASCSIAKSTNFDSEESYLNFQNMAYVSFLVLKIRTRKTTLISAKEPTSVNEYDCESSLCVQLPW